MHERGAEVDAAFDELHGRKTLTPVERMNLRYEVAKNILESQEPSLTAELEQRAAGENESALQGWKLALRNISASDDVSQ